MASTTIEEVRIPAQGVELAGTLIVPQSAALVVVFAHGSGSSRHSPRNQFVAHVLNERGLGTLLFDLLTSAEGAEDARTGALRFDIPFLAERLVAAVDWLAANDTTEALRVGCFGASTGGGAALVAAAERPQAIVAVVSRGGRPDLAGNWLAHVKAPTLLIVGGRDAEVIKMNEWAREKLRGRVQLELVPGATHLFEEPGALEKVAELAANWFANAT